MLAHKLAKQTLGSANPAKFQRNNHKMDYHIWSRTPQHQSKRNKGDTFSLQILRLSRMPYHQDDLNVRNDHAHGR